MKKKQLMAILNCTPDSFFDGGKYNTEKQAIDRGVELFKQGADIVDIGGESTRPFSKRVSLEEECQRVLPVIEALAPLNLGVISIDTYKPEVAEKALMKGATFVNDITGFEDPRMERIAFAYDASICVLHMQHQPENMQNAPFYPEGVVKTVGQFFEKKVNMLLQKGWKKEKIYLDVGIGFGKTVADNLILIKNLEFFLQFNCPLLIGLSRKSFMQKFLKKTIHEVLSTTLALNTISLLKGVSIVRVHDVNEHKDLLRVWEALEQCEDSTRQRGFL